MQLNHNALRVVVVGQSGMGKSTFLVKFLNGAKASCKFVFDPEGEFQNRLRIRAAFNSIRLLDGLKTGWVIYDPSWMFPGRAQEGFNFFAKWAWTISASLPGRKIFACDELQRWSSTGNNGFSEGLSLVLDAGRRQGLDSILVTQASNAIHNRVRGSATEVVAFRTTEPRPLAWLAGQGFDVDEIKMVPKGNYVARVAGQEETTRGKVF